MDFALKILGKYGWKEGEGLGKNSNGIAKPLKATLKFDNAGFGADQAAADFNNHWWERVFNEAASNVDVKQEGETVKMDLKDDEDGVEISTKGYSMKKLKKAKRQREKDSANGYDNFLQAATLTNLGGEVENPNKIDASDIEVTKIQVLTDEELFKACGGRTAHKGARHGLKLSGKLSRIEQQEEELLAKLMAKRNELEEAKKSSKNETTKTKLEKIENLQQESSGEHKKKKSKTIKESKETLVGKTSLEECKTHLIQSNELKKKKKKRKHTDQVNHEGKAVSMVTTDEKGKNGKKVTKVESKPSQEHSFEMEPKIKKGETKDVLPDENEHIETESKKKNKEVNLLPKEALGEAVHKKRSKKKCRSKE